MWSLFVLFTCLSWAPLLLLYLFIISVIRYSWRAAVSIFLHHQFYNEEEIQALIDVKNATDYEQWAAASRILDTCWRTDKEWKRNPVSSVYRWKGIERRVEDLTRMIEDGDVENLSWRLGQFPVRHYCNITDPKLYRRLRTGTKELIERFIDLNVEAVNIVASWPTANSTYLTDEIKLDSLRAPRVAFGRTALLLQGDGIFGLFHLGVVKELLLRGLLPRVIVGSKTGALVAALTATYSDVELTELLSSDDLKKSMDIQDSDNDRSRYAWERTLRLLLTGNTPHQIGLAGYVASKIGNITFMEAFERTQKPLSITIQFGSKKGMPVVMNYLTAPHANVVSAAMASSEPDPVKAFNMLLVKGEQGDTKPWDTSGGPFDPADPWSYEEYHKGEDISPLADVRQCFNVNHFVVSQTRPLVSSFLTPSSTRQHYPLWSGQSWAENTLWLLSKELRHRIRQAQRIGIAPDWTVQYLQDEILEENTLGYLHGDPHADNNDVISLVPNFEISDIDRLLGGPDSDDIQDWILRGQRAVWPAVSALDVRCGIEVAYEYYYQKLKHATPAVNVENTPIVSPKTAPDEDPFEARVENPFEEMKKFEWPKDGQNGRARTHRQRRKRKDSIDSF